MRLMRLVRFAVASASGAAEIIDAQGRLLSPFLAQAQTSPAQSAAAPSSAPFASPFTQASPPVQEVYLPQTSSQLDTSMPPSSAITPEASQTLSQTMSQTVQVSCLGRSERMEGRAVHETAHQSLEG